MIDMNQLTITFDYSGPELTEINRNLTLLFTTAEGTAPLDRYLGLNQDFVSYPTNIARTMLTLEIIKKVTYYEPRVKVKEVTFTEDLNGLLKPNIILQKGDE